MIGKTSINATADPTSTKPVTKHDDVRHNRQQLHLLHRPILSRMNNNSHYSRKDSKRPFFIQQRWVNFVLKVCACAKYRAISNRTASVGFIYQARVDPS